MTFLSRSLLTVFTLLPALLMAEVDLGLASTELQEMTKGRVHDVKSAKLVSSDDKQAVFEVTTTAGDVARVEVQAIAHRVKMLVKPKEEGLYAMLFRTGEVGPVYGLSDHGSMGRTSAELSNEDFGFRSFLKKHVRNPS